VIEGGDSPMRLACAVVDVLTRYQLVDVDLFARLSKRYPEWEEPLAVVKGLWFEDALDLDLSTTYAWSDAVVGNDFDVAVSRRVVGPPPELGGVKNEDLRKNEAWRDLFGGADPSPPVQASPPVEAPESTPSAVSEEVVIDTANGPVLTLWEDSAEASSQLGTVPITLKRRGTMIYLEAGEGLQLNGQSIRHVRLSGGEALTAGELAAIVRVGDIAADAPIPEAPAASTSGDEEATEIATGPVADDAQTDEPRAAETPPAEVGDDEPTEPAPAQTEDQNDGFDWDDGLGEGAPVETPQDEAAPELSAAPVSGWPVAELKPLPAESLPVVPNPAAEHAAEIWRRMTPPPAQPRAAGAPSNEDQASAETSAETSAEASGDATKTTPLTGLPRDFGPPALPETPMLPPLTSGKGWTGNTIVPEQADLEDLTDPPTIEVMSGPLKGTTLPIGKHLSIGSGPDARLHIADDERMGALHCEVTRDAQFYVLKDLDSDTGTVINGQKVGERTLDGGEVIMVGRTVLRFNR